MKHRFIYNIICAFIWKRSLRDKVRTMLRFPQTFEYIRYIRNTYCKSKNYKIKTTVGYGCKNFVIILDDKYVFKFPLRNNGYDVSFREKRITDALRPISPIKIPEMEIIKYKDIFVRKYEFAKGTMLTNIKPDIINKNAQIIAKQLAEFLYIIGKSDPQEINDLKTNSTDTPNYMHGWFHNDIAGNFFINKDTLKITYFIDWENTIFGDFIPCLITSSHFWDKNKYKAIMPHLMAEYSKLYFQVTSPKSENILKKSTK